MPWSPISRRSSRTTSRSPAISSISRSMPNSRRRGPGSKASARREHVTVVPGNHDAYVRATRHRFAEALGDYMRGDGAPAARFPFLRRRGPLALIGVSSAVPTAPLMATGSSATHSSRRSTACLARLSTEQLFRVLLMHHPLHSTSRIKRLTDWRQLQAVLEKHGVELVLHGHDHIHSTMWLDGPTGAFPRSACRRLQRSHTALSGSGLQSVFDRTRRRTLALRADRARHQ